jgi:hypothetical protein
MVEPRRIELRRPGVNPSLTRPTLAPLSKTLEAAIFGGFYFYKINHETNIIYLFSLVKDKVTK